MAAVWVGSEMPLLLTKNQISTVEALKGDSRGRVVFLLNQPLGSGGKEVQDLYVLICLVGTLCWSHCFHIDVTWSFLEEVFSFSSTTESCSDLPVVTASTFFLDWVNHWLPCFLLLLPHNFVFIYIEPENHEASLPQLPRCIRNVVDSFLVTDYAPRKADTEKDTCIQEIC